MKITYERPALWTAIIITLLTLGAVATGYGLFGLAISGAEESGWRVTYQYLLIFLVLVLLVAAVGLWRGAGVAGVVVTTMLMVALGAAVPAAVVLMLALSSYGLGRLLLRDPDIAVTDCLLAGIVLFGTVLGLLVHLPVNDAGTWGVLFALPLVMAWRHVRALWPVSLPKTPTCIHLYLLHCGIAAAVMLHVLVGLMPEVGHDALVTHLFVPAHVDAYQSWHFDATRYAWAVMPMFVDWLYTAGYFFAGEVGARLVNVGSLVLLVSMVHRLALWAGASRLGAGWAVLLLLATPLTFLESSSLFIEGMWSALVMGGTLALLRLLTGSVNARSDILLSGLLLGGALAAKAVTFTVLPVLALVMLLSVRRWFDRDRLPAIALALLVFAAIGGIPYVTAYVFTGNPIFPFFNAYFQSPLYPLENFSPPAIFARGMAWDTLYQMTFDSGKYLEATVGAAGFQWLLLVMPGVLALMLAKHRRALLLGLVGLGWLWLTFWQTAYLRYALPSFGLACVLAAMLITVTESSGGKHAVIAAAVTTLTLNLLHFHSGTYYGKVDLQVITDAHARDEYIRSAVPVRAAIDVVNALNHSRAPVAFFSAPLTAGLHADALYANWYNPRYLAAVSATGDATALGRLLARENVEYVVVEDSWVGPVPHQRISDVAPEIARVGSVSVRRLDDCYRYTEELLPSSDLGAGWQLSPGAIVLPGGGVQVGVESSAYVAVPARAGGMYRYTADARCANGPAEGRLQVNWLSVDDKLARADIDVFSCALGVTTYSMDVQAPPGAVRAIVYASAHTAAPVVFSRVSFRN